MKYDDGGAGVDLGEERLLTTSPPPRNVPVSAELDIELLYLSAPYLKLIPLLKFYVFAIWISDGGAIKQKETRCGALISLPDGEIGSESNVPGQLLPHKTL